MSADMYSTAPTLFGSLLIAGTPLVLGDVPVAEAPGLSPYVMAGAGACFVGIALTVTGSIGGTEGLLRFCATVGALACAFAAWRFWPMPALFPLAVACAAGVAVFLLWGWGWARRMSRAGASDAGG